MRRAKAFIDRVTLTRGGTGGFFLALSLFGALMLGSCILAIHAYADQERHRAVTVRTIASLNAVSAVRVGMLEAIRGERGYLITGDLSQLAPYHAGIAEMNAGINMLEKLGGHDGDHALLIGNLRLQSHAYLAHLKAMIDSRPPGAPGNAIVLTTQARDSIDRMDRILRRVERQALARLDTAAAAIRQIAGIMVWYLIVTTVAGVALLCLAAASVLGLRRSLARERLVREELQLQAQTDELTGLANRREFHAALNRHIALARRHGTPLSLAIFDIDHFKQFNDRHGHTTGDAVLRRVAEIAVGTMRGGDLVGRIGGEEFAVLLPNAGLHEAAGACERLRTEVRRHTVKTDGKASMAITISTGLAHLESLEDASTLMDRADTALYQAKNLGRDRLCLAA